MLSVSDVRQEGGSVSLMITAPEEARETARILFEQFVGSAAVCAATNCCSQDRDSDA